MNGTPSQEPPKPNRIKEALLVALLIAIAAVPRFIGLGKFTSIDEPFWLRVSGNFYYALGQRQFANTIYEYHPAVTTMWVIAAGMLAYFPEYRHLGQGYLKPGKFDAFLPEHGKSLLQLLIVSRAIQVIIVIILLVMIYFLLRALFGWRAAFLTTAFVSLSPYFLGHSRLLNHEAMMSLFLVVSLLGMLVYLYAGRRLPILLLSAAAAGLAQLTKSSGLVFFPLVGLVLFVAALGSDTRGRAFLDAGKALGIWLLATAAAYVLFWPGMWVAPGRMLYEVYGNALTYAFHGQRLSVAPGMGPSALNFRAMIGGLLIYLNDLVWRTTPWTWLGLLAAIALLVIGWRLSRDHLYRLTIGYCVILGALFVLLFGIQQGPKPPHYILTSYVAIDLIAGLGWSRLVDVLEKRSAGLIKIWAPAAAMALVLVLQAASALAFYPYYISYYNPVAEALQPGIQNPTLNDTGYGVGLDQAAAYLAQKPGASGMTVMSANGMGSFSYYFPGRTVLMNNLILTDPEVLAILPDTQYVVMDYYNQKRYGFLAGLEGIQPEKSIWINGIEFLRIYRSADLMARINTAKP